VSGPTEPGEVPRVRASLALDARAELGEGPHWDPDAAELVWVDIMAGAVHRFDPRSGRDTTFEVGQPVGAAVPRRDGGFVLALRDGVAVVEGRTGGALRWLAALERENTRTRMNDAACDPAGRLWAGTMDLEEREPLGTLYRCSGEGEVEAMLGGLTISNGLGWSPQGEVMYYIDTARRALEAFDFDLPGGTIAGRRTICSFAPEDGEPDGLTVDATGDIWVAFWEGWAVRRFRPDGRLAGVVEVPAARVTSCAFGGAELETLFVTTARPDLPDPRQPHAGGVFAARPGVQGLPAFVFAG
jgi:sugar lactone lactonase YvrE